MIFPIILYGNPILRKKCKEITASYNNLNSLISNMFKTMYQANGIGLAAPQLGFNIKLFVIDSPFYFKSKNNKNKFIKSSYNIKKVFINPILIKVYGKIYNLEEGCLSIPKINENINRPEYIIIEYYDQFWKKHKEIITNLPARVIQHEYDHLNGKLFIDYLSYEKKNIINKKFKKILKNISNIKYKILI